MPELQHHIVSDRMFIFHPKLKHWETNTNVCMIIKEIEKEFLSHPPKIISTFNRTNEAKDFKELGNMGLIEIQELIDDDVKLFYFLQECEQVKIITQKTTQISIQNQKLAKENCLISDELSEIKTIVDELQFKYDSLREEYEEMYDNYQIENSRFSNESILHKLRNSIAEIDHLCDQMVESHLYGNISDKEFVDTFLLQKQDYHLKSIIMEKLRMTLK